jgi:hypothetical protein
MPITINGSGSIAGLSVGGLPDGSVNNADLAANAVSTGKILNGAVTTAKLGPDEQLGLAKAWVNFNGTGTVAIRAQYNVSSITDNGTGDYTVNFTTALVDANYSGVVNANDSSSTATNMPIGGGKRGTAQTSSSFGVRTKLNQDASLADFDYVFVAIFR